MVCRLVYVVTAPITLRCKLVGQIEFMSARGYDIHVIVGDGPGLGDIPLPENVTVHAIPLVREISLWHDVAALWAVCGLVRQLRPQIVNSSTPKAGLIGMVASWMNRVPVRVHTLRGLRHETLNGVAARVLSVLEKVTSMCATRVISVSSSLRDIYVGSGLCPASKVVVLGGGSSNGVDICRFDVGRDRTRLNSEIRQELAIPADAPVIGYFGRFTRDKGFEELCIAFEVVQSKIPEARLLLVGEFEDGDPVPQACRERLRANRSVVFVPFVNDPSRYYSVLDVLAFPSYREGFPVAPLEAAAARIPTVAFEATGTVDVIRNGETGIIVPIRDSSAFAEALIDYLNDRHLRNFHGTKAHERVKELYRPEQVWADIDDEFRRQLVIAGVDQSHSEQHPRSNMSQNNSDLCRFGHPQGQELVVIGCGGHAKVVIQTARAAGFEPIAIYDDDCRTWRTEYFGVPVVGPVSDVSSNVPAIIALGKNEDRQRISEVLNCRWATVIHPNAVVDASATIGEGTMILAGCVVQADANVGRHVIMNTASTVDHDSSIGDFCHLCPGVHVAGDVRVGDKVTMGTASSAIPRVSIGDSVMVGAGAVVIADVPSGVTALGVPARILADPSEGPLRRPRAK